MNDNTVRLHDTIYAYIDSDGFGCFSWSPREGTTQYIRADVAAAQLDAERERIVDAIDAIVGMNPSFDVHLYAQAIKAAVWNDEDEPQEILKRELKGMPK